MRQTALIAILAHTGSFVPADNANLGRRRHCRLRQIQCDSALCEIGQHIYFGDVCSGRLQASQILVQRLNEFVVELSLAGKRTISST